MNINIMDAIYRNEFLHKLFPIGLNESILIGHIGLDDMGRLSIGIHTKQKPAIEVPKWGVWGKDYEVIVINLSAMCKDIKLKNWRDNNYGDIIIRELESDESSVRNFLLFHTSEKSSIEIECDMFYFHGCSGHCEGIY